MSLLEPFNAPIRPRCLLALGTLYALGLAYLVLFQLGMAGAIAAHERTLLWVHAALNLLGAASVLVIVLHRRVGAYLLLAVWGLTGLLALLRPMGLQPVGMVLALLLVFGCALELRRLWRFLQ